MTKYYAVRNGRSIGIFNDWGSCSDSVIGYSRAEFKSFNSASDASSYMHGGSSGNSGNSGSGSYGGSSYSLGHASTSQALSQAPSHPSGNDSGYDSGYGGFSSTPQKTHTIYTDGASKNNQSQGKSIAGYGVYYGDNDSRNTAAPLEGSRQTNQRAELTAISKAMDGILEDNSDTKYGITTDSKYSLGCMGDWGEKWRTNGFRSSNGKPVENRDIIEPALEKLDQVNQKYQEKGWGNLEFNHVRGHVGVEGNEKADQLANEGCRRH
ncbi:hypothetical protein FOA43_004701 [Brettanomyces nanus]|uniref:Ribonuclease H n=1 Tax=Eeniella nana TaxID=13502 RepID=A0A875S8T8_EENNA|nr:uncharacterized protein FOA43_004701 [Brettanomyces nanus]QPG77293.1 hypothetical protein FOA43_004701 [Brettanomyces nanus]